jgi:hypothetical protein
MASSTGVHPAAKSLQAVVRSGRVNAEYHPALLREYGVSNIPSVLLITASVLAVYQLKIQF